MLQRACSQLLNELHLYARSTIAAYQQPFPILVATLLSPNANFSTVIPDSSFVIPTSSPIIELNICETSRVHVRRFAYVYPYLDEMGSYDPTLAAFTPMKYLGTTNETLCVTNLDQIGTVVGASGEWNTYYNTSVSDRQVPSTNFMFRVNPGIGPREFLRLSHRHRTECYSPSKRHCARFGRFPERFPRFSDGGTVH